VTGKPIKFVGMGGRRSAWRSSAPTAWRADPRPRRRRRTDQQFEEVVDEEKAEQDAVRMLKGSST